MQEHTLMIGQVLIFLYSLWTHNWNSWITESIFNICCL